MVLKVDKFGRVVLPKKIREHLGVGLSLKVEVTETAEGILFKPVQRESSLVMQDGLLIHQGNSADATPIDWRKLIQEDRDERIQHILNP